MLQPVFRLLKTERYAADAAIEPYPARMGIKGVLRRIVQLCKRHRDIHFADNPDLAPLSIIITTLAARSYEQCVRNGVFDDEIDLLISVLRGMPGFIAFDGSTWRIPNETTRGENFAEKWNAKPALAGAFYAWHGKCASDLERLLELVGRDQIQKSLSDAFGSAAANQAMQPLADRIGSDRATRRLAVAPGIGLTGAASSSAGSMVRPNTFFGAL